MEKKTTLKERVYDVIRDDSVSTISKLTDNFITWLIVLNIAAIIAQSYKNLNDAYSQSFYVFELFSVVVFSIEYLLRLWTSDLKYPEEKSKRKAAFRFVFSQMGIIDLLAILPFYLDLFLPYLFKIDMRFLRMLRLMRLLRIFKLQRHSSAFKMVREVLAEARPDIMVTLFVTFILMVISASLMYYIESHAQPDKFANIGESFWWAVATLTTVGYGDVFPITGWGKLISGIIALLGIGMVALPTGVISSAFIERVQARKNSEQKNHNEDIQDRLINIERQLAELNTIKQLKSTLEEKDKEIQRLKEQLKN